MEKPTLTTISEIIEEVYEPISQERYGMSFRELKDYIMEHDELPISVAEKNLLKKLEE